MSVPRQIQARDISLTTAGESFTEPMIIYKKKGLSRG